MRYAHAALLSLLLISACDDEPTPRLVGVAHRQVEVMPPKGEIDLLFVIDDSPSMCAHQPRLAHNIRALARDIAGGWLEHVNLRIAVTTTDGQGRFIAAPAPHHPQPACAGEDVEPYLPDTRGCEALVEAGELPTILTMGPHGNVGRGCEPGDWLCREEDLEFKLRCLTQLPLQSEASPKSGFHSIQQALSCEGPNAAALGLCCISERECSSDKDCDGLGVCQAGRCLGCNGSEACGHNRDCMIGLNQPKPQFFRPDARLFVVVISSDDDQSSGNVERHLSELVGLRRDLAERLTFMAVTGHRIFDAQGDPLSPGLSELVMGCEARSGLRYLQAADVLGSEAPSCPPERSPSLEEPRQDECLSICSEDWFRALTPVGCCVDLLGAWCLERPPYCEVGEEHRPCLTDEERADTRHYPIQLTLGCREGVATCGDFEQITTKRTLPPDEWNLQLDQPGCAGGALVHIRGGPQANTRLTLEYLVDPTLEVPE